MARYYRFAYIPVLLVLIAAVPSFIIADGGHYAQTPHGNSATGVRRDPSLPTGSCAQCHAGHGSSPQDFGLWTANDNSLCFTCHANSLQSYSGQTLYNASGHATSTSNLDGRPVGRCVQCHNPHGKGDSRGLYANMTDNLEEENCFNCHGTGIRPTNAVEVRSDTTKPYSHRVGDFERKHDNDAESTSVAVNPNSRLSGSGRHVECADCHNTHQARSNPRASGSSNIGEMQLGSWGVRPTYINSPWSQPTGYTVQRFQDTTNNYEYYLCLKCHSNWAWGNAAPYTTDGTPQTNIALEINPANPAYHNVTGQIPSLVPSEDSVYGNGSPLGYVSPWGPNSQMGCSDCHAGDPSSTARGPHGSTYNYMLKKRYKAQTGASDNTGTNGTQQDLCFSCHDWNTYSASGSGNGTNFRKDSDNLHRMSAHNQNGCGQCHSAVPHGFNRKHMIVYVTDGAPYFTGGTKGILSYTHANGGAYNKADCTTTPGCHGN